MFISGFFKFNVRSCAVGVSLQLWPTSGCNISTEETRDLSGVRSLPLSPRTVSAAEKRTAVTPDTRTRLPASRRMSVGAARGLASSGQKPITEILHPLSAAEEPLSPGPDVTTVSVGGDKVGSAGDLPRPVRRFIKKQGMERGQLTQLNCIH